MRRKRPANSTDLVGIAGQLRSTAARYREVEAALVTATTVREEAIREAHRAGMTMRAIAAEADISHQRVAQILAS